MPLPQQVIDRLSQEPPKTPGWSFGIFTFSGGMLALSLLVYFGLTLGYEPYLDGQITQLNTQLASLAKAIPMEDQTRFITLYSQVANMKTVLGNHVALSRFFSWLEKSTEANVYYSNMNFSGSQVALTGLAATEADVNQQMAIFEADPAVKSATLATVSLAATGRWQFTVTLNMNPASMLASSPQ